MSCVQGVQLRLSSSRANPLTFSDPVPSVQELGGTLHSPIQWHSLSISWMGFSQPRGERWGLAVGRGELSNGPSLWGTACQHLPLHQVQKQSGRSSHPTVLLEPEKRPGKAKRPGFSADSWRSGASSQVGKGGECLKFILPSLDTHWQKAEPPEAGA